MTIGNHQTIAVDRNAAKRTPPTLGFQCRLAERMTQSNGMGPMGREAVHDWAGLIKQTPSISFFLIQLLTKISKN